MKSKKEIKKEYSKQYYLKNREKILKYYKDKRIKQYNKPCLKIIHKKIILTFP